MPNRYLIANWKMNLPPEGVEGYMGEVARAGAGSAHIVVAPPFPYLREVAALAGERVAAAAQNCGDHDKGAFTGEVAPSMIRDCGAKFVIIGHSERRSLYGETDALIARKLTAALAGGLTPVLCIGEDLRTRDAGRVSRFLADQVRATSVDALAGAREVIIAYEPVWAIGTGRNASGLMVAETVAQIREALLRFWPPKFGAGAPILYGGSVTPENIADLSASGRVDGYLVGGASLDSRKFVAILNGMNR
jgi:triosephosphate isomerase